MTSTSTSTSTSSSSSSSGSGSETISISKKRKTREEEQMGWLTESALQKKPAREIHVETGTIVDLRAALFSSRTSSRSRPSQSSSLAYVRRMALSKDVYARSNPGLAQRQARDAEIEKAEQIDQKAKMAKKAEMYEKLVSGRVSGDSNTFLVDFERKGWELTDQQESSALTCTSTSTSIGDGWTPTLNRRVHEQELERQAWEEAALRELKEGKMASERAAEKPTTGVRQNYEKTLSEADKEALQQVLLETADARARYAELVASRATRASQRLAMIAEKNRRKHEWYQMWIMQIKQRDGKENKSNIELLEERQQQQQQQQQQQPIPSTSTGARSRFQQASTPTAPVSSSMSAALSFLQNKITTVPTPSSSSASTSTPTPALTSTAIPLGAPPAPPPRAQLIAAIERVQSNVQQRVASHQAQSQLPAPPPVPRYPGF